MLAGLVALVLVVSTVAAACTSTTTNQKNPQQNTATTQQPEFKPLDTKSKKVIAEYQDGGKVIEGDANAFINIVVFDQPQAGSMVQNAEQKDSLIKEYASLLYISKKLGKHEEYVKKAAEQLKSNEKVILEQSGTKAKTLDELIKDKGFTLQQMTDFLAYNMERVDFVDQMEVVDVKVNHVLVSMLDPKRTDAEAKKRADEVKTKLEKGGDFKAIAKEYSDDPGSKETAGLIEGPTIMYATAFAEASKTLPLNKISDPVKTEFGYHVMKVTERTNKKIKDLPAESKDQSRSRVYEEFMNKFQYKKL